MTLFNVLLLLGIIVVGLQFWRIRAISEKAQQHLEQYCQQQGLQLISMSRGKTRLASVYGKLDWHSEFSFEFSGNGEDTYQGRLIMGGVRVLRTELPPYRM